MLIVGYYCFGIRSERRLCEDVHLNLAYHWFCRLGLTDRVPDHSTFSKNRHRRFRDSELLRHLFETVVAHCIAEGLGEWPAHGNRREPHRGGREQAVLGPEGRVGPGPHRRGDSAPRRQ